LLDAFKLVLKARECEDDQSPISGQIRGKAPEFIQFLTGVYEVDLARYALSWIDLESADPGKCLSCFCALLVLSFI
jgi:hypothetical protein